MGWPASPARRWAGSRSPRWGRCRCWPLTPQVTWSWPSSSPRSGDCNRGARRDGPLLTGARGTGLAAVVRLAISNPVLRATTIMFAVFNVGEGALLVLLPHRAAGLGLGAGGYGYL